MRKLIAAGSAAPLSRVPTRRGTELLLVVLAVLIAAFGYADVGCAIDGRVPADTVGYALGLGVLALLGHLACLLFFGMFVMMLYVATGRVGWIAVGLVLVGAAVGLVAMVEPHVHSRFVNWLN
ncbi:hypothetical protein [Streptacidiphilus sp. EB129]|uniref:hypothetical protein n=1 Tax=Streptacidiphilus sp. EB129 TaxID=3156262 RepID=UPI0035176277